MANFRSLSPLSFLLSLQKGQQMPCQFSQAFLASFAFQPPCTSKNVFLRRLINDILWLVIEFSYFVVIIPIWRWDAHLYNFDIERDCPLADSDEPAGGWATSPDSVHDVVVNKKSKAMLVFILFSTEGILVSFLCCWFAKVLPSYFTESKDVLSVLVHFVC